MAHDSKKVLYFVRKCSEQAQIIKRANDMLVTLKAEWVVAKPNVAAAPVFIVGGQAVDFNNFAQAINNAIIDAGAVIDEFETIANQHPSHNPKSMTDWD